MFGDIWGYEADSKADMNFRDKNQMTSRSKFQCQLMLPHKEWLVRSERLQSGFHGDFKKAFGV